MKKTILKIMLGSIILEAVLVCIFILIGKFTDMSWQALSSVGIIFLYSIPCLFYSKIYDDKKYKYIAITGAIFAFITAFASILGTWELIEDEGILEQFLICLNIIVWMLALMSWILSYASINKILDISKKISITLIALLSFILNIIVLTEKHPEGFLERLYYVIIVITVGSFICTLIITKIYKKELLEDSQNKKK